MINQTLNRTDTVQFGAWTFCCKSYELIDRASNTSLQLEPKIGNLLQILLTHHQQLVSKEDIIEQLWHGVIVSEDTLAKAVSRLRASLNDSAANPLYIKTIPKRGYKFIHAINSMNALTEEASEAAVRPLKKPVLLIAVAMLALFKFLRQGL